MEKRSSNEQNDRSDDDDGTTGVYTAASIPMHYSLPLVVVLFASVLLLGSYAFYTLVRDINGGNISTTNSTQVQGQVQGGNVVVSHCGTTPEEAQERGCFWDIMSFGWVHPDCYDKTESDKWIAQYGPWEWHMGTEGTSEVGRPLSEEELPYTPVVMTTQGYHIQHCLYVLKMIHVAGMKNGTVTNEGIALSHTDHCIRLMADPAFTEHTEVNTRVHLLFVQCVSLR